MCVKLYFRGKFARMGKFYFPDADIIGVTVKEHYRSQSGQEIDYDQVSV